jgi:hypothetical protein
MPQKEAARGGRREGAGRKKNEPDVQDLAFGKGFATRVLARIKELKLHEIKADGKPGTEIKSAEDYALDLLRGRDAASREFFKLLLAYQLGKPVQPTITADTRENVPALDYGKLPRTFDQPRTPGKPN